MAVIVLMCAGQACSTAGNILHVKVLVAGVCAGVPVKDGPCKENESLQSPQ